MLILVRIGEKNLLLSIQRQNRLITLVFIFLIALFLAALIEIFFFNGSFFLHGKSDKIASNIEYKNIEVDENGSQIILTENESEIIIHYEDKYIKKLTFDVNNFGNNSIKYQILADGKIISKNGIFDLSFNLPNKSINVNKNISEIIIKFSDAKDQLVQFDNIQGTNLFLFNPIRFLVLVISIFLLFFLMFFYLLKGKISIEVAAVVLILSFGGLFSFLIPPHHTWDEYSHFIRSYNVAQGNFIFRENEIVKYPIGLKELDIGNSEYLSYDEYMTQLNHLSNFNFDNTEMVYVATPQIVYTAIPYLASGLGVKIAILLNLPIIFYLWLGRLANVIVYTILVYFSLKIIPMSKKLLCFLVLLPISVFLAASFSVDVIINGFSILAFSLILRVKSGKEIIKKTELILIWSCFIIITMSKVTYAPLFLLFFLLKIENFQSVRQFRIAWIFNIVLLIFVAITAYLYGDSMGIAQWTFEGIDSKLQIEQILFNPLGFVKVMYNYLSNNIYTQFTSVFADIAYVGRFDQISIVSEIGLIIIAIADNKFKGEIIGFRERFIVVFAIVCSLILSITALYITFTPVGYSTINGFQGRYLIPLIFPLFWMFQSKALLPNYNEHRFNTIILMIALYLLLTIIWTVLGSYYF